MDNHADYPLDTMAGSIMTPELATEIGVKFGLEYKTVVVIKDTDPSSEMIYSALIAGLLSTSAKVIDAGVTPVSAAHIAFDKKYDCLLSVGNPDIDGKLSGIKAYDVDGTPYDKERFSDIIRKKEIDLPPYSKIGLISHSNLANQAYIDRIKKENIHPTGYVILDCGCKSTSLCAPQIFTEIGAEVVAFNSHMPTGLPPRPPGLNKTDLMIISNFVNASIGSVGLSFNGDGTRLSLVDESGKFVPGEKLLSILLMYLEPTIAVVPFDSPRVVEDAFSHPLGIIERSDNGVQKRKLVRAHNDLDSIIQKMKEVGADFGALNDGTFIFPQLGYCPDAIYAGVIISELAGKRSIRNVLESIPIYSSRNVKIAFDGNLKRFGIKLMERIDESHVDDICSSEDAWKVVLEQGTYIIKQNDNDPEKLVILAESADLVYLITMLEQAKDIVRLCI